MSIIKLGTGGVLKFGTTNAVIKMTDATAPPWQLVLDSMYLSHIVAGNLITWEIYNANPVDCRAYYEVYKDFEPTVIDSGFEIVTANNQVTHDTSGVASSFYQINWYLLDYPADPDWTQSATVADSHQL